MKNWYLKTLLVVLLTAVLMWAAAIVAANRFGMYISTDSVAVTVMGVIAGIIVIGNYAQVHEMDQKHEKRINELEATVSEMAKYIMRQDDGAKDGQEEGSEDTQSSQQDSE
ncbi:MAG: hypothetical protein J6S84_09105 [Bacteroidales bacterium]|nr:hypothetical protein [Bacteroidales bacterium]